MTRMVMTGLNQKWWDEAIAKIGQYYDCLSDYDREFYDSMIELQGFEGWSPTVKQWNFLKTIASRL